MVDPERQHDDEDSGAGALAETLEGEDAARRLPTPIVVQEGDDEEGPDPFVGKVLSGLYKVEKRIGEGGMGTVYSAVHVHLKKRFAVKVLSRRIAADRAAVKRLLQEAVAASSIDHDNIVDVVSFDRTDEGDVFIVMELLKGESLANRLDLGPLPLEAALPLGYQIGRALHAAHEANIVHRDLKPENIFLIRKGDADFVKVLDFGISKVKSAETEKVRMTKTGQLVGTPLYMSPEQAKGEADIDRRADVYALGVILYEMLTGSPPFEGGNYFQLLWKHGNETPPRPTTRNPDLPGGVERVLMKALEKEPSERYQDMAELEMALLEAAPDVPVPTHFVSLAPAPPRTSVPELPTDRRMHRMVLGGVLALVGVTGLVIALGVISPEEPEPPPETSGNTEETTEPDLLAQPPDPEPIELPVGVDTPPEAEPPAPVPVSFGSHPRGAMVTVGGHELGTTPLSGQLPPSDTPVEVRFSKPGYIDAVVSVVPVEGAEVVGQLRPRRRGSAGQGGHSSIKTEFY